MGRGRSEAVHFTVNNEFEVHSESYKAPEK